MTTPVAALLGFGDAGIAGPYGRRDDAQLPEFGLVQKVERRDAGRHAIRRHAGELASREGKTHHVQLLRDLECEPRVGARIQRERRQILAVIAGDLGDAIAHVSGNGLSLAENLARHGIERVIVHADESAAQQIDAVEYETARNARLPAAEIALGLADAKAPGIPAQCKRMAHALCNALQYRQVEIDDVPTRQHIGIEAPNPIAECLQRRKFIGATNRLLRHRAIAAVNDEHLVDAVGVHRDRQQARMRAMGFDVE